MCVSLVLISLCSSLSAHLYLLPCRIVSIVMFCVVTTSSCYADGQSYSLIQEIVNGCNLFDYLHKYHKTVPIGKQLAVALQVRLVSL